MFWGYGHYVIFASAAAAGVGIAVAVDYSTGHAHISGVTAGYALVVPVALYLFFVWLLHIRPHQPGALVVGVPGGGGRDGAGALQPATRVRDRGATGGAGGDHGRHRPQSAGPDRLGALIRGAQAPSPISLSGCRQRSAGAARHRRRAT
jgi:hypothetical protein